MANPKRLIATPAEARALHDGGTVEVWRAMKPQPKPPSHTTEIDLHSLDNGALGFYDDNRDYVCPFPTGSRWWVAETYGPCDGGFCYQASEGKDAKPDGGRWFSPATMFRDASRTIAEVIACRVELREGVWHWVANMKGEKV